MENETPAPIEVPWENLSQDVLASVIDDFVLREGTDYGWVEKSLEQKRDDILRQLKSKRARILFEPESESITLVVRSP